MRWLNSQAFRGHRFLPLYRILFLSVILCFLVAFSPGLADTLIDPTNPAWEHPWDDLDHQNPDESGGHNPSVTDNVVVLRLGGWGFWIIIDFHSTSRQADPEKEGPARSSEKNRGHVLMLVR